MGSMIRILVVDEELEMREGMADILEEKGYQVSSAANGYEAIERIKAIPFDIIIIEIKTPYEDSLKILNTIRDIRPDIPIIAMTGYPFKECLSEMSECEIYDYLTKPFEIEYMLMTVERAVERDKLLRENRELLERLKDVQAKFNESQDNLLSARKFTTIGQLTPGVSHEIKNILGIINVSAHYLTDKVDKENPKALKHLTNIEKEVKRCNELIINLLNFSHRKEAKRVTIDIEKLLDETLLLIEHQMALQNIKVTREYMHGLPRSLGDIEKIKEVFINIILNASDAMPNGGELRIKTGVAQDTKWRIVDADKAGELDFVEIIFRDTGCGILKENLNKIFTPFFTTKDRGKGTGLGLSICRRTAEEHHGNIEVESEAGKGTAFFVRLPISK